MKRISLKGILAGLNKLEHAIVLGDHSNTTTMKYFALLSNYYYYGGTVNLTSRIRKSGILDTTNFSTEKAKTIYLEIAQLYVFGGQLKLRISKSLKDTKADLFGVGTNNVDKVISKIKKFTVDNDIDIHYNKNTNVLSTFNIKTRQSVSRKLDNWSTCNELENLIANRIIEVYGHDYKFLEQSYYEYVIGYVNI